MRQTLEQLRGKTKEEKTAIAGSIALGVVAVLFLAWIIYFFHSLADTPAPDLQNVDSSINSSGLQQADQQLQQAYGSTTQFIQSEQGTIQLEEVSSTSEPSL